MRQKLRKAAFDGGTQALLFGVGQKPDPPAVFFRMRAAGFPSLGRLKPGTLRSWSSPAMKNGAWVIRAALIVSASSSRHGAKSSHERLDAQSSDI